MREDVKDTVAALVAAVHQLAGENATDKELKIAAEIVAESNPGWLHPMILEAMGL